MYERPTQKSLPTFREVGIGVLLGHIARNIPNETKWMGATG